eukprot:scaffold244751_cov15-Tisochrysis_lutea.AAC.1
MRKSCHQAVGCKAIEDAQAHAASGGALQLPEGVTSVESMTVRAMANLDSMMKLWFDEELDD